MLVLTRKIGEEIILPDCNVTIAVISVAGSKVKLGVTAPAAVPVHRREVWQRAGHEEGNAGAARGKSHRVSPSNAGSATGSHDTKRRWSKNKTSQEIERELTEAIAKRTGGRVKSVSVLLRGDRLAVYGDADSYHAVQLANAGLLEALNRMDIDRPDKIELHVEVVSPMVSSNNRA